MQKLSMQKKKILRSSSLSNYVICVPFLHTREWDLSTQVCVEPVPYPSILLPVVSFI